MIWVCEALARVLVKSGVQSKLPSDVCAYECISCLHGRKLLHKDLVVANDSFGFLVNRSRGVSVTMVEHQLWRDLLAHCID